MAGRTRTLTRADWLAAGLRALDRGGLGAVKILPISKEIGASRGSFYWHFTDRADLLRSVLAFWESEYTDAPIRAALDAPVGPEEQLWGLMQTVIFERQGRYDPAIRAWALHDREAAEVVRRVDRKRLDFLRGLFRRMGFGADQREARIRLTLGYLVSDHVMLVTEPPGRRRKLLRLRHRILTKR